MQYFYTQKKNQATKVHNLKWIHISENIVTFKQNTELYAVTI
jgi:hypothetical protein